MIQTTPARRITPRPRPVTLDMPLRPWLPQRRESPMPQVDQAVGPDDGAMVFHQLATMLDAGLSLQRAVAAVLAGRGNKGRWKHVLVQLRSGHSFSQAARFLPQTVRLMLMIGEEGGDMSGLIRRVADHMEAHLAMRRRLTRMLVYPMAVFVLCMIGVAVLPALLFHGVFNLLGSLHVAVPFPTRLLMAASTVLTSWWGPPLLVTMAVLVAGWWRRTMQRIEMRRRADDLVLRLPWIGDVLRHHLIAGFALNLASLYSAGVPVQRALRLAGTASGNLVVEAMGQRLADNAVAGEALSDAMRREALLPALIRHMVATGEAGGCVVKMLRHFARMADQAVEQRLLKALAVLEPMMYAVMGTFAGVLALASLSPLLSAMENLVQ